MTDNEVEKIEADARADVARLQAWQGLAVDVLVLLVSALLAYLGAMPSEVVSGLFGSIVTARTMQRGGNGTFAGPGAVLGFLSATGVLNGRLMR